MEADDSAMAEEEEEAEEEAEFQEEGSDDESGGENGGGGDEDDDEDDGDDDDDDQTEELERQASSLTSELSANPYLYDKHVQLINLRRRLGDLGGLRDARESMHSRYPLSPSLWLDWLRDEQRVLDQAPEDVEQRQLVESLFRRAIDDYASVDVATEFCLFAIGQLKALGADAVRNVFEECLASVGRFAGLHDQRVWESYQEFELLLLSAAEADAGGGDAEATERQRQRVKELYRRRLSMPHVSLERTWSEFAHWLGADEASASESAPELAAALQRSREELQRMLPFEERLQDEAENSAQHYRDYIAASIGSPAQQLAVMERAVVANCLDAGLWDQYVQYVWEQFEAGPKLLKVCERSVRNCPWCPSLWCRQALCLESMGADWRQRVRPVYEAALGAGIPDAVGQLTLWRAYLDSARRQTLLKSDDAGDSALGDWCRLCEAAERDVDEKFGREADPDASLLRYRALVLAKAGQLDAARQVWSGVMRRLDATSATAWLSQLEFELRFGDRKHARRCLGRAVNSVSEAGGCELLYSRYLEYEGEEGDLSGYIEALKKIRKQRSALQQRAAGGGGGGGGGSGAKRKAAAAATAAGGGRQADGGRPKKAKTDAGGSANAAAADAAAANANDGFKKPLPPGAAQKKEQPKQQKQQKHGESAQHDPSKEYRTVFVSNLDFNLKEAELREALSPAGELASVRLVRDYRGRSKGYAYAEYKSSAEANAALGMDRQQINGRPMFVSECKQQRDYRAQFQFSTGLERNKLFVKNLPKTMDQAAFEAFAKAQPNCVDARLAVFRNGAPKGHGYVEFADEASAQRAMAAMDGMMVGDSAISVAISNPPAKRQLPGSGKQSAANQRAPAPKARAPDHQKARISLVPRQLAASKSTPAPGGGGGGGGSGGADGGSGGGGGGKMSNDDFRNLLLGKK